MRRRSEFVVFGLFLRYVGWISVGELRYATPGLNGCTIHLTHCYTHLHLSRIFFYLLPLAILSLLVVN